ncbi:hypothetical protein nbrc107696_02000 [Gordonia spumicola]|uniref:DUF445 domain-containing protein n=1 Tax=Gordonia spumicola TaxID=589161 RepID=A0A7I9V3L4_9ACTN|nr:DUF445 domain-containing protein [Gordonia spumicola]GED99753.1 hypothetical protein nbrc107696_02000 [Gordonia spumicola]
MQSWSEIVADVERNWVIYASMPVIAALIGWGTKIVAIRMMFRPHRFKGIGRLGWQGIIPKRAPEMVAVLCETLTGRLISSSEIVQRIDGVELAALIDRPMRAEVARIVNTIAPEFQPTVWHALPEPARDAVIERAQRVSPDVVVAIADALTERIDEVFDLQTMVTQEFLSDPETLEKMFSEVGRREFAFIRRSGLVFGFLIGLVQVLVWALFHNPWVMPLFGLFTGWFTDWAALRLIFNPKEPTKYFGVITWQGLFLKHRIPVSEEYAVLIASRVLTTEKLMRGVFDGPQRAALIDLVAEILEEEVRDQLGDVSKTLRREVGDLKALDSIGFGGLSVGGLLGVATDALNTPLKAVTSLGLDTIELGPMCQAAAADMVEVLPSVMAGAEDYLTRTLDIETIMAEKMKAMTPEEFEGVLRPAFQADERTLIIVGAVLGFMVGELQVLLVEHFTV